MKLHDGYRSDEIEGFMQNITEENNPADEVDENTIPDMREGHEYYRTPRGQHPNSTNRFLFSSFDKIMAFSAFEQISTLLTQPLLLIAGSKAGSLWQSEKPMNWHKARKNC